MINRPIGLLSIQDFIRWGASRFAEAGLVYGHGTDNALDEGAELVLFALHLPSNLPDTYRSCRLTPSERCAVLALLERRIEERRPVAYLTQRTRFAGLDLVVNEDVLIPRSPIAELIERGFAPWVDPAAVRRVLDLGTGSGCIGIAAAVYLPDAAVDLVDNSAAALRIAGTNAERHRVADRVELIESDLFDALGGRRYDVIVSNPPYVSDREFTALPEEYHFEPRHGLAGGSSGLDLVLPILARAGDHLNPDGVLIVEVGTAAEALVERCPDVAFLWLEFDRGGDGVFLLTKAQLEASAEEFARATPTTCPARPL